MPNSKKPSIHLTVILQDEVVQGVLLKPSETGFSLKLHADRKSCATERKVLNWINAYLNKKILPVDFAFDIKQFPSIYSRKVLEQVKNIPFGKTVTYGDLAEKLDSGPRAVGNAMGTNPFPLFIPCHRVLAKNGLGGFSCGLEAKVELLKHECVDGFTIN